MSAVRTTRRDQRPDWRAGFVEELGGLATELGASPAAARVLAWMVVCEPPEQSAADIQSALELSAGAVSAATRVLVAMHLLERTARARDRRRYYRLRPGGWVRALEQRLRTSTQLRDIADRTMTAAGPHADSRLRDMRDAYAWFESALDELLARRTAAR